MNKRGNVDQKPDFAFCQSNVLIGAQVVNNWLEYMSCASQLPPVVRGDVAGTGRR